MIHLYPSAIQFHCGVICGGSLLIAGMAGWAGAWEWTGALGAIAFAACIASAFIATREGR